MNRLLSARAMTRGEWIASAHRVAILPSGFICCRWSSAIVSIPPVPAVGS